MFLPIGHSRFALTPEQHAQYWKTTAAATDEQKQQNNDLFFLRPNRQQPTHIKYKETSSDAEMLKNFLLSHRWRNKYYFIFVALDSFVRLHFIFFIFFRFRVVRILLLFYPHKKRESVEQRGTSNETRSQWRWRVMSFVWWFFCFYRNTKSVL